MVVPDDAFQKILTKVADLTEPLAEGTTLAALSYFPPLSEGVDAILTSVMKRPTSIPLLPAIDLETAVALFEIHGHALYLDVREGVVRDNLVRGGVPRRNFVHFA